MPQGFGDIQRNTVVEDPGYETLFEKIKAKAGGETKNYTWYRNAVRTEAMLYNKSPDRLIRDEVQDRHGSEEQQDQNELRRYTVSGHMYLFEYNAKFKMRLPYWDSFPLVYVTQATRSEFWGANLHYLAPKKRVLVARQLMEGRINIPKACFHKYLTSNVEGYFLDLASVEWATAILLPLENFVRNVKGKAGKMSYTKEMVWEETQDSFYEKIKQRRVIRGYGTTQSKEMVK
tara:strand:+ start:1177 stop:1872 length:696 start_codon:yes stop_codon:yes gene_type:complete